MYCNYYVDLSNLAKITSMFCSSIVDIAVESSSNLMRSPLTHKIVLLHHVIPSNIGFISCKVSVHSLQRGFLLYKVGCTSLKDEFNGVDH